LNNAKKAALTIKTDKIYTLKRNILRYEKRYTQIIHFHGMISMLKRRPLNSSFPITILVVLMFFCLQMNGDTGNSFTRNAAADNYWNPYFASNFNDWTLTNLTLDADWNLTLEKPTENYTSSGNAISGPIDTGAEGIWKTLDWEANTSQNTSVRFQLRNGTTLAECISNPFSGPLGPDTYYTVPGSAIGDHHNSGNWIQFEVFFNTTNNSMTPVLHNVSATYNFFPRLQGGVSIVYGIDGTSFNFTSSYYDRNNAPPSVMEVIINDLHYGMIEKDVNDTDYTNGKEFLYNTTLAAGTHYYSFIASDGELNCSTAVKHITVEEEGDDDDDDDDDDPTMEDLKSVDIFPKNEIVVIGGTIHFNAEGINKNDSHMAINPTWAVNGGGTIDEYGLFTANTAGNWYVYANVSGIPGRTTFSVSDGKLHEIIITPETSIVPLGGQQSFTFQGFDKLGLSVNIVPAWSVNGGGTIDSNGGFSSLKLGTWTVYANASGISGKATVNVGGLSRIEIYSNETSDNETYINVSESINFIAKGYDSEGNEVNFDPKWSAPGGEINENGTFTATSPGRRIITASFGDVSGSVNITVIRQDIPQDDDDTANDDSAVDDESERSVDKFRKWAKDNFPIVMMMLLILLFFFSVIIYFVFRKKEGEGEDEESEESPYSDDVEWGKPLVEKKIEREDTNEWEELDSISEWDAWTVTDYDLEAVGRRGKRSRKGRKRRYMPGDDEIEWDTGPIYKKGKGSWSRYKPRVKKRKSGEKRKGKKKFKKEDKRKVEERPDYDEVDDDEIDFWEEDAVDDNKEDTLDDYDEDTLDDYDEDLLDDYDEDTLDDYDEDAFDDYDEDSLDDYDEDAPDANDEDDRLDYNEADDEEVDFREEDTFDDYEEYDF